MSELVRRSYDALAPEYDARYRGGWWPIYDRVTIAVAETYLPRAGAILDVGSGTGRFAREWLARGYDVTLVDPSPEMLRVATRRLEDAGLGTRARYVVGSMDALDFDDNSFDFVFSEGDPLSYCMDTHAQAAKEVIRVLRPGAGFYVSCDNRGMAILIYLANGMVGSAVACHGQGDSKDPYGNPVHAFTPAELEDVFAAAGATSLRVSGKMGLAHLIPPATLEKLMGDDVTRTMLTAFELEVARDPTYAGVAGHLHVIGRKHWGA